MSEIAMVSARKTRLESAAKKGNKNAKAALEITHSPNRFFSTVQIGITLIGILTGMFSGEKLTTDLKLMLDKIDFLQPYSQTLSVVIILIIITFFSLVLGELVPKRLGLSHPESIAKAMARPMNLISKITSPFVWLLTFTTDVTVRLLNIQNSTDSKITEEEIKAIIQEGTEGGAVQEIEQDIVERVFNLGDRRVNSLMTHRNGVIGLEINSSREKIKEVVNNELHSIYPVYNNSKDEVVGVVTLKDLFAHLDNETFNLSDYLQSPRFIPSNTSAYKALEEFKKSRIHYVIITDEYGLFQGILTMNDILEALVGDASEFYSDDYEFVQRDDGSWLIDGHYPFHDFLFYFDLGDLSREFNFNTVSGLILYQLKRIPQEGDKIKWRNFEFEVVDMDGVKIDKLLLTQLD